MYSFANGDRYEGAFQDNYINGHGTYTYANGSAPKTGQWKGDETSITFLR